MKKVRQEGGIVPTGGFEEEFAGGGALVFRVCQRWGWDGNVRYRRRMVGKPMGRMQAGGGEAYAPLVSWE